MACCQESLPSADVRHEQQEFYQVKNKTGSAKGSDGEKLGRQFVVLAEKYPNCKRFYVSMIGKTLAGHRSMGAFLRTDPGAEVLVGLAAFQQLGGHRDTAAVVLDLYVEEFREVCAELHFDFTAIATGMAVEWHRKHGEGDPAHRLLHDTITPTNAADQSSHTYGRRLAEKSCLVIRLALLRLPPQLPAGGAGIVVPGGCLQHA